MTSSRLIACLAALGLGLALAACETTGSGAPSTAAAPQALVTRQSAAMDCWMATEKANGHLSLDKRADIVDRCIAEKLKSAPPANH